MPPSQHDSTAILNPSPQSTHRATFPLISTKDPSSNSTPPLLKAQHIFPRPRYSHFPSGFDNSLLAADNLEAHKTGPLAAAGNSLPAAVAAGDTARTNPAVAAVQSPAAAVESPGCFRRSLAAVAIAGRVGVVAGRGGLAALAMAGAGLAMVWERRSCWDREREWVADRESGRGRRLGGLGRDRRAAALRFAFGVLARRSEGRNKQRKATYKDWLGHGWRSG